ncbi:MAG: hypothetical protein A2086_12965 [Spirochaetes bacterium GWD1_27_9]|nr:MAG: hypothetical protein A2Z98_00770 [Spirochaetes bacterium GWB1_27_13]OHD43978.1 MAG: hypothetical protein A2086_12965 [Spirochaetes bacterium GWD1_27_9]
MSVNQISENDRIFLLQLARKTIEKKEKKIWLSDEDINKLNPILKEKRGGFVTLHKDKRLRGCIGYILPMFPLYQTVIENAYNAAYGDPRFPQVKSDEIKNLNIEISILSVPEELVYKGAEDLLEKLKPNEDGVIIKKGFYSATFLPQVWEELANKEEFLEHLCLKAGLSPNEWKKGNLEVEIYHAEAFRE